MSNDWLLWYANCNSQLLLRIVEFLSDLIFSCYSSVLPRGVDVNPASVKQSLMRSAVRLPNFNIFEQGMRKSRLISGILLHCLVKSDAKCKLLSHLFDLQ